MVSINARFPRILVLGYSTANSDSVCPHRVKTEKKCSCTEPGTFSTQTHLLAPDYTAAKVGFTRLTLEPCRTLVCLMIKFPLNYFLKNIFTCMGFLFACKCVYVPCAYLVPMEARRDRYPRMQVTVVSYHVGTGN